MFRQNFVCFSSALVRRAALEEVGLFDEGLALAIDYDLWLRVALRYPFDYVAEPLVKYRTGHASLSQREEERLATAQRIMRVFLDEHGGRRVLSRTAIRCAQAETYYHIGLTRRWHSSWAALPWFLRALTRWPGCLPAWRELATLPLPAGVRRWLRRAVGLPVH
jgi:GT2 family glycosyltransferase